MGRFEAAILGASYLGLCIGAAMSWGMTGNINLMTLAYGIAIISTGTVLLQEHTDDEG